MYQRPKIVIVGAGGIGRAACLMLAEQIDFDVEIAIGDIQGHLAKEVVDWILRGSSSVKPIHAFSMAPGIDPAELKYALTGASVILDCLPGSVAPQMVQLALDYNAHYVNLTEYVSETDQIIRMTKNAETGFILQSGLAPGYINILAHKLYQDFVNDYGVKQVEEIGMRVGALTQIAKAPHFYGFTWSPIGVATEYVKEAVVVKEGIKTTIPSLSDTQQVIIDGIQYEEDYTSGGAADIPDAFAHLAKNISYKTIRYPGHFSWAKEQLSLSEGKDIELAFLDRMLKVIPHAEDDFIILYAYVKGFDKDGVLRIKEQAQKVNGMLVGNHQLRAIQVSTAAPMLEAARMLIQNKLKGPILQSQIDPKEFLNGPFVQMVYSAQTQTQIPI